MKQMGTDLSAIQEIHNQQKAKLYAELADWKARALKAEQAGESTPNDVVAGALYDFLGYLTSRRTRVTMSDRDDAGPAVDALVDWSKTRKITLEEARVEDWQNYTTPLQPAAQEPTSAVTVVAQLVEALEDAQRAFSPAIHVGVSSAIAAGQKFIKESGK